MASKLLQQSSISFKLSKQKQNYKLLNNLTAELPDGIFQEGKITDPAAIAETIVSTLKEHKIKATNVATAVPMRDSIIRIIPIPQELDEEEMREMLLNHEAALYLPYPREEVDRIPKTGLLSRRRWNR